MKTKIKSIRNAWRHLGTTHASPAGWMSDDELETIAKRIPKNVAAKTVLAESLKLLQASRS